ncbi:hypothetical protein SNR37_002659 [Agarivorans aestuarii]|uniref:DUF304 domain-containing protein n=1 Tax=Agarivorans aestuarii TaxID=1563703 RepID=A0ABU7G1Q2_9ALTE|nr:hypothetical protein [Agarivorans aestuarii]MEE1673245.1 hypothetical protein [Agarivorans aestuarii]
MNFEVNSDYPKSIATKSWLYVIGLLLWAAGCAYALSRSFNFEQILGLIEFVLLAICLVVSVFAALWKFNQIKSLQNPRPLNRSITLSDSRIEQKIGKMIIAVAYKDIETIRFDFLNLDKEVAIVHLKDGQSIAIRGLAEQVKFREQLKVKAPHAL